MSRSSVPVSSSKESALFLRYEIGTVGMSDFDADLHSDVMAGHVASTRQHSVCLPRNLLHYIFSVTMTSVAWGVVLLYVMQLPFASAPKLNIGPEHTIFYKRKYMGCGNSTEEAKAQGCEYDVLSNAYLPKVCIDKQSISDYQKIGPMWKAYEDANHTKPIESTEDMGNRQFYYTNLRDHVVHCAEIWKKQFRAFSGNNRYFDTVIGLEVHTKHCADFLVEMTDRKDSTDLRNVPIKVGVGFGGCVDRKYVDAKYIWVSL